MGCPRIAGMIGIAGIVADILNYMTGQRMTVRGGNVRGGMGIEETLMDPLDWEVCKLYIVGTSLL